MNFFNQKQKKTHLQWTRAVFTLEQIEWSLQSQLILFQGTLKEQNDTAADI